MSRSTYDKAGVRGSGAGLPQICDKSEKCTEGREGEDQRDEERTADDIHLEYKEERFGKKAPKSR